MNTVELLRTVNEAAKRGELNKLVLTVPWWLDVFFKDYTSLLHDDALHFLLRKHNETFNGLTWLVLQGDWGGQIYLTVPWCLVGRKARIGELLRRLDQLAWGCNSIHSRSAYLTTAERGVSGGMGGGKLEFGLWLHDEFLGEIISAEQELVDICRGATCDEVRSMNWREIAYDLLSM